MAKEKQPMITDFGVDALIYAHTHFLSKKYQDVKINDKCQIIYERDHSIQNWPSYDYNGYKNEDVAVFRPNQGLCLTARIQILACMLIDFNLKHAHFEIQEYLKIQKNANMELFIAKVQVALAFSFTGAASERVLETDEQERYWKISAGLFKEYVAKFNLIPNLFCNQNEVDIFAACFTASPPPPGIDSFSAQEKTLKILFWGIPFTDLCRMLTPEEINSHALYHWTAGCVQPLDPEVQHDALLIFDTAARLAKQMGDYVKSEYDEEKRQCVASQVDYDQTDNTDFPKTNLTRFFYYSTNTEACIALLNQEFDYTPNRMQAQRAFRTRSKVDSRDFDVWYHNTDMERIIWAQYKEAKHKETYLEPYVFYDNYDQSFDDIMQSADQYFRASEKAYFPFVIKPELGAAHYIAGIIRKEEKGQNTCFIFNPLGYQNTDSKEIAKKRLNIDSIHFVGGMKAVFSPHAIQKQKYDGASLKSCGPICAAFIDYALNHPEWVQKLDSRFLLPNDLKRFLGFKKKKYVSFVCDLRKHHDALLGMILDSDLGLIDDFYQRPNQYFLDRQTKPSRVESESECEDDSNVTFWQSGEEDGEDMDADFSSSSDSDYKKYCNDEPEQDKNLDDAYSLKPLDKKGDEMSKKKEVYQVASKAKLDPFDKAIGLLPQGCLISTEIDKLRQCLTLHGNKKIYTKRLYNLIAKKTHSMVQDFLDKNKVVEEKLQVMDTFQKEVLAMLPQDSVGVVAAKIVAAIILTCVVTTIIALAGMGIGMVAGLWTGFGAIPAALAGTLGGVAFGASVGITVAAAVTGVSLGAFSTYAFFRPDSVERQVHTLVDKVNEMVNVEPYYGLRT